VKYILLFVYLCYYNRVNNIFDFTLPKYDSENFYTQLKTKNVEIKTIVS